MYFAVCAFANCERLKQSYLFRVYVCVRARAYVRTLNAAKNRRKKIF